MRRFLFATLSAMRRTLLLAAAAGFAVAAYGYLMLPDVRELATSNPETTAFMKLRRAEAAAAGEQLRHLHEWVPYARISQNLTRAVLTAEDSAFWDHEGIDMNQIRAALRESLEHGTVPRGASTVTQQLAKNLYLSPSRDPTRKIQELIISRRLEAELSKMRILEIYLNVVEWGDGVWGAEAAAHTYFGVSASQLTRSQAALLAGALINPRRYDPSHPTARLLRRQKIILSRLGGEPSSTSARTVGEVPRVSESLLEDPEFESEIETPEAAPPVEPPVFEMGEGQP